MIWLYFTCLLFFIASSPFNAAEDFPKKKSEEEKIEQNLAPSNALLNRIVDNGRNTTNRAMLIFLDETEYTAKILGAITKSAMIAIIEAPCPIIISTSLLLNIINCTTHGEDEFLSLQCANAQIALQEEKWLISEIAGIYGIVILIPRKYVENLDILYSAFFDITKTLKLGLNLYNIKKNLDTKILTANYILFYAPLSKKFESMLKESRPLSELNQYADQYTSENFLKAVNAIFVPRTDYTDNPFYDIPQWSIYITGHGTAGEKIAGININEFRKFLHLLNYRIVTKFLVYDACFSAGTSQQALYNTTSKISKDAYNFPIMAFGTAETASVYRLRAATTSDYSSTLDFKKFVEQTTSNTPITYINVALGLIPKAASLENYIIGTANALDLSMLASNLPLIRPPQFNSFIPLIRVFEINDTFVASMLHKKELDVTEILGQKASGSGKKARYLPFIFVSTDYIPFSLKFSNAIYPIISTSSGKSLHVFEGIVFSPSISSDKLVAIFNAGGIIYAAEKTFIIKSINTIDSKKYEDIVVQITSPSTSVTSYEIDYTYKGGHYSQSSLFQEEHPMYDYMPTYEKEIKAIKEKYKKQIEKPISKLEQTLQQKIVESKLSSLNEQLQLLAAAIAS